MTLWCERSSCSARGIWHYSLWVGTTLVALRAVLNLLQLGDLTLLMNEDVHE